MSATESPHKRMLSPSTKGKGISRQNPRYAKGTSKIPSPMEKKVSAKSLPLSDFKPDAPTDNDAENDSVSSKASFFNSITKLGGSVIRNSRSILHSTLLRTPSKNNEADEFFFVNAKNKWRAEKSSVFKCEADTDNSPTHIEWRGFSFAISQNTGNGRKPCGQDSIGVASNRNWEVFVICDGHDQDGHMVSQGVCAVLPHFLLRRISMRAGDQNKAVEDELIIEAFEETEATVCWSAESELEQGDYVKLTDGELAGQIGYIADFNDEDEDDEPKVTVVVDNTEVGYHRIDVKDTEVIVPRYKGGSTCLCFIRNHVTNKCKVAVLGDTRLMAMGDIGSKFRNEDFIDPVLLATYIEEDDTNEENEHDDNDLLDVRNSNAQSMNASEQIAYFTPQHNVYSASERDRLKAYQKKMNGEFVVNFEEGYLVNPETKMQIQPTRGFGDVEMQSCGYSHVPEISSTFTLTPNTVLVGASDGIFDGEIWANDEEFLKFIFDQRKAGADGYKLSTEIYLETTKRVKDHERLDDISLFVFVMPQKNKKYRRKQRPMIQSKSKASNAIDALFLKRQEKGRTMKSRRSTIQRIDRPGANLFRKFFTKGNPNILDG